MCRPSAPSRTPSGFNPIADPQGKAPAFQRGLVGHDNIADRRRQTGRGRCMPAIRSQAEVQAQLGEGRGCARKRHSSADCHLNSVQRTANDPDPRQRGTRWWVADNWDKCVCARQTAAMIPCFTSGRYAGPAWYIRHLSTRCRRNAQLHSCRSSSPRHIP